jgi:predicted DNA-binding antitoxin AbrB/MazE fold protein
MAETVWAVYEHGVLRLLEPVALREGQRVRVRVIEGAAEDGPEDTPRVVQEEPAAYAVATSDEIRKEDPEVVGHILAAAGLLVPRPSGPIPPNPVSEAEREAIARRAGRALGKTASEMIIEDRGDW